MLFTPVHSHDSESELLYSGVTQDKYKNHKGKIF